VRHPKKKSGNSKAANDELVRRLSRMEELIERIKVDGKEDGGSESTLFMGGAFLKSLMNEVRLTFYVSEHNEKKN